MAERIAHHAGQTHADHAHHLEAMTRIRAAIAPHRSAVRSPLCSSEPAAFVREEHSLLPVLRASRVFVTTEGDVRFSASGAAEDLHAAASGSDGIDAPSGARVAATPLTPC